MADLVEALLVKEDIVVELVLYLGFGPGLLLGLGTLGFVGLRALGGGRTLIFCRQLLSFSLNSKERGTGVSLSDNLRHYETCSSFTTTTTAKKHDLPSLLCRSYD